jgi:hypothetical protein
MAERMRSSVDVDFPKVFNVGNPPLTDGSLIGLLSNPPVPPFGGGYHRSLCCLSSFNKNMRAKLTLIFVFMLLNLTSIWKLPTLSTGAHGRDGVPRIVGPRVGFFIRGHARKVAP